MSNNNKPLFSGLFVQYNEGKDFLMEVHKSNPDFRVLDYRYITPVAYPIAFVEVEALERTKEDFSIVEKTVLKLLRNRFIEPAIIARVMGLTESYIEKVIKLLFAYGQVDENGLTEIGLQSLAQNTSIKMNTVKQDIPIDGLTASPIDISSSISEEILRSPRESGFFVAHLKPVECIEKSVLEGLIMSNYTNYVNKGEMSLHTNVEKINYAKFKELKFAKAYYLEKPSGEVVIMCKSYDSTARSMSERFIWKTLYADNSALRAKHNPRQDSVIGYSNAREKVMRLKHILELKRNKKDKDVVEMISQLYSFNWSHTEMVRGNETILYVTIGSFYTYDRFVLKMLESLADGNEDYIIFEELYGEYIRIRSQDADLLNTAREYKEKSEIIGRSYIMNSMERLSDRWKGDMFSLLKHVIENNEQYESDN